MSSAPALELTGLTKRYDDGFLALDAVDLSIADGAFFGLLGPNGAGKTTLISAVCNLIRVTAGEARIFGHPHAAPAARRLIGLAEQDVNLDRFLDVEETLVYHGGYYGMSRADARRRAGEMMDVFDLRAKATTRAPKLSGGMRRRLLLARERPDVVLLDHQLRDGDGIALCRRIKAERPDVRVILYTASAGDEVQVLARVAGAGGIVDKAAPPYELFEAIRRVARGASALPPLTRAQLDAAAHSVEPDDLALLAMLVDGTPAADVAATLRMDRGRVARRTERMMGRLRRPVPRTAA